MKYATHKPEAGEAVAFVAAILVGFAAAYLENTMAALAAINWVVWVIVSYYQRGLLLASKEWYELREELRRLKEGRGKT